ncbi:MAG: hypothetical protein Kow0029_05000 [Candidatus Rifleibacteriota bacterium]
MKRLRFLFFALLLIFNLISANSAFAIADIQSADLTLLIDADGNGYINYGDTIRIRSVATFTVAGSNWDEPPNVDLSSIGFGTNYPLDQQGSTAVYQADILLNSWRPATPNYTNLGFTVRANQGGVDTMTTNSMYFDLVQVAGFNASVSPTAVGLSNSMTIAIDDTYYQSAPLGGTIATVDLTPIGGANNVAMPWGGADFRTTIPAPAGQDYTGPLTITLKDPFHPAVSYLTNTFTIDTNNPAIDAAGTNITIMSGNATALPGDVLRLTARVTSYDNETVTASCTSLTAAAASPALNAGAAMTLVTSNGIGQPAEWQLDVVLASATLKNTNLPIVFRFVDNAGNVSVITRTVAIDLEAPSFVVPDLQVRLPDGTLSGVTDIATTGCQLTLIATVPINAGPDSITVTADLSPIAGPSNFAMTRVGTSDQYKGTYTINPGTLEDGAKHSFVITAKDAAGNMVARGSLPEVGIDNSAPIISGLQLTNSDANITVGDVFTITLNVSGIENGSVTVDLSSIGLGNNVNIPNTTGTTYSRSFTLTDSTVAGIIRDGQTSFTVSVNDTVNSVAHGANLIGHVVQADTNSMMIDNEPAIITGTSINTYHKLYPSDDFGYVRIGDYLSFHAQTASAPVNVRINMLALGQSSSVDMVASSNAGWYDAQLFGDVATGTINRQNVDFSVWVIDDAGNTTYATITVPIDNQPVQANGLNVNTTYIAGRTDNDPSIINLNKHMSFQIPFTVPAPDDVNDAQIDLAIIGGAAAQVMTEGSASFSYELDTSPTASSMDSSGHKFEVIIRDDSGNRSVAQSNAYVIDCFPPTIVTVTATQVTGGTPAKIGDTIRIAAQVIDNENTAPTVDLSNIGGSATQVMTSIGGGWYEYVVQIATGTIDNAATQWTVTAWDDDQNYVTANTNNLTIDNLPPQLVNPLSVSWVDAPADGKIMLGDTVTFVIDVTAPSSAGGATIDLTPLGGGSSVIMPSSGPTQFTLVFTSLQAASEFTNYRFKATITDTSGNVVVSESSMIAGIDCQAVTFSGDGIDIYQDNGDNPVAGIANVNDILRVYASASAYLDATVQATIGSGTVDFATATMVFNPSLNRHEATFTVNQPGTNGWGILNGDNLYYKLTAVDDVGNIATMVQNSSSFIVRNVTPTITATFTLSPDFASPDPVYNLGTDTVGDKLNVTINFADDVPVNKAWLDFSDLGSGTVDLAVNGSSAATLAGIAVTKFAALDGVLRDVRVIAQDEGGNQATATYNLNIDNVSPTITSAEFDGSTIRVNVSEMFSNLQIDEWKLVGSNPPPLSTPAYLDFTATQTVTEDIYYFDITLTAAQKKEIAQWASTSLYLQITNVATSPLSDISGNELKPVPYYPVTLTDSSWREPAKITQFTMTQTWPGSIRLDMIFNKAIDPATLVASSGVLLVSNLSYDFNSIDYTTGYVFQPADLAGVNWQSSTHLQITLCDDGRDWVARKLGNGTNKLKFATRSAAHIFAYDTLGKKMDNIPTSSPIEASDNRPTPTWSFDGPPNAPTLDLASRTLKLTATDRILLFTDDFTVQNTASPTMGMPQPTLNNGVSSYHNKIILHDIDSGNSATLSLEALEIPADNSFASTTVTLKLTDNDVNNIFNLFQSNATPVWRIQINAGAFHNLWGTANDAYLPSGNPGAMVMINPTGYNAATLAACSMNDKPPVNEKNASELIFEVEIYHPNIGGVDVPIQTQIHPTAQILQQIGGGSISNGAFLGYSSRTVAGQKRTVARYSNTSAFAANLQRVPATIQVNGITDIFGNAYNVTASYAYDLNLKNDTSPDGFNDPASAPIEIDTLKPTVLQVIPDDVIGKLAAGSEFRVIFSESMDPLVAPTLRLATNTSTISFSFAGWLASDTAKFTNNTAFTSTTPNGTWTYEVTGGRDEATNTHDGISSFEIQVRTYTPEVANGNISVQTVQSTIDSTTVLTNEPWSPSLGNVTFRVQYTTAPTQFLPHYVEIYDAANNKYGRAQISVPDVFNVATATFTPPDDFIIDPGLTGPTTYMLRVVDSVMNQTDSVANLVYDNLIPDVTSFTFTGVGSETATTSYYRPTSGNFTLNVTTATTVDTLRLAVYSYTTNATTTMNMTQTSPGNYSIQTGNTMANGSYTLTIVDLAGNIGSGPSSRKLVVDSVAPTVTSIFPDDIVGNCPVGGTTFKVTFSEMMDAAVAQAPTLTLATAGTTINMNFVGWADPDVATTAIYTNADAIVSTMPSGDYYYSVSGGMDLAHNSLTIPGATDFEVEVQSKGPFARIDSLTLQPHIYDTVQTNLAFSPDFGNGSTTLNIDYSGGPFNTPHDLQVFDSSDTQVATFTALPAADPASIQFSGGLGSWLPGYPIDGEYRFKIRDSLGNVSGSYLPETLRYDTASPSVDSLTVYSSFGIATDTPIGFVNHYSPLFGAASFTFNTAASDKIRLMIINSISTYTADTTGNGFSHETSYGTSLADGYYFVSAVDLAGNMAVGPASRAWLLVDTASPTVISATPNLAGGLQAGVGIFDITFSEHMNTGIAPTASLATNTAVIGLNFVSWISTDTCRFTNAVDINSTFPAGTYSYHVSGARDLAGNMNVDPASGSYEVQLFTTPPAFNVTLRSRQNLLFGTSELLNRPFSVNAAPNVATLSISYTEGPFQVPHSLLVFDPGNVQVASIAINPDIANKTGTATVDAAFFGTPGNLGPVLYSMRLLDNIGNLSATSTTQITYDALEPTINTAQIASVSDASAAPLYYNNQIHGDLNVKFTTNASDPLILVLTNGVATSTFNMTSNPTTGDNQVTVTSAEMAALPEGVYAVTSADLAGNFGVGPASFTTLIIDRTIPNALSVTAAGGFPLSSSPAGGATFTVTFDEDMNQLASATPSLVLATAGVTINCTFESWLSSTQARFVTAQAITPDIPQGDYFCGITAWDLTGNKLATSNFGPVQIRSRGPVVSSFVTRSFQSTTASDSSEILTDMPFSFNVAPGAATMSIQLAKAPDTTPLHLHFMQNNVTIASYTLANGVDFDPVTNAATFTWSALNGPVPTGPTTYQVKLVDDSGDFSLESYNWTMDASAPAVMGPVVTGGALATNSVYFNPVKQGYINIQFSAVESEAPKLRILGTNSTDTYQMSAAGTNLWSGNFEGRYSRGATPKPLMPDGIYHLDVVDRAGNVALLASGDPIVYDIIIDTMSPGISTYSTLIAGNPVTAYSPSAGNLEIRVVSTETLDEQGIFWMEVLNSSNVRIRKLPISNVGGNYTAYWDGKDKTGATVIDGNYTFRATDYVGNPATGTIGIFALTTEFKTTGSAQISSGSAKIWFNHEIDAASLAGAVITAPGLTISNIAKVEAQAISFNVSPTFTDQTSYTFTITPGTIKSIFGSSIAAPNNTATLVADGKGPVLESVSFENLTGQQEFKVIFNESYKPASASDISKYSLTGASGTVTISQVTTQSDTKTVLITAAEALVENADYQISVTGIEDIYGNLSPASNTLSFKGRDLTPPVLEVSAFSNPANENDIIVVVIANETLKTSPTLHIAQSNAPVITTSMQVGSDPLSYMIGVHLSSSYPGNGTLAAYAEDLAGNQGSGNSTFTVAYLSANKVASIKSADEVLQAEFSKSSLKSNAFLKIIAHKLEKSDSESGEIRTAMQRQARTAMGIRASQIDAAKANHTELVPVTDAYEVSIDADKIDSGFTVFMEIPKATESRGLGLFYQNGDKWKFVSSTLTRGKMLAAKTTSSQVFAIMRDIKAPEIIMSEEMNFDEPIRSARPEFRGAIAEAGSGIDMDSVSAHIDAGPAQPVIVDADGNFVFKPMADLTGGNHDLIIKSSDRTGNVSTMSPIRFAVAVPLRITQIAQYPNPARSKAFIRISANRNDIREDLVKVKIYDTAGHRVTTLDGIKAVNETWGVNARFLYDIPWDLRNASGKLVANGVYFAKIEIKVPDNPAQKVKETFKIAVLR